MHLCSQGILVCSLLLLFLPGFVIGVMLASFKLGNVFSSSVFWKSLCRIVEKEMATHFCILAWRIPWTEEPGGLQSGGHKESTDTTEQLPLELVLSLKLLVEFADKIIWAWR